MKLRPLHGWPQLRRPFLVVTLQGWVDAGSAAQGASLAMIEGWDLPRVALSDGDYFVDYQHRRPRIRLDEDGRRRVEWQEIEVRAGSAGPRDVVVLTGPEPARHWHAFIESVIEMVRLLGVTDVFALGGLPAPVPHTQPVGVAATATTRELADGFDVLLGSYEGPTGVQTVLQVSLGEAGIPAMSLWAQVPHYLAAMDWPAASASLLRRLGKATGTSPPVDTLLAADRERRRLVDRAVAERPDLQALVRGLEGGQQATAVPSGDDLADEIERFLADRREDDPGQP
jgi:proteasome assembly chaperone (PAC2) family protein